MIHTDQTFGDFPLFAIDDLLRAGSLSATSESADHPVANLANGLTFDYWQSQVLPPALTPFVLPVNITVDAGADVQASYGLVVGHNLVGIACQFQSSADGETWETRASFTPENETIDMAVWAAHSARYWRLQFVLNNQVPGTPSAARIAVLRIGQHFLAERRIGVGHSPLPLARDTTYVAHSSERGHSLDRALVRSALSGGISLQNLTPGWYRQVFDPFARRARTRWFAFAWRPDTYPAEVVFAESQRDIRPDNQRSNGMVQVSFPVRAWQKALDPDDDDEEPAANVLTSPPYPVKSDDALDSGQVALQGLDVDRIRFDVDHGVESMDSSLSLPALVLRAVRLDAVQPPEPLDSATSLQSLVLRTLRLEYDLGNEDLDSALSLQGVVLQRVRITYENGAPEQLDSGLALIGLTLAEP